MLDERQVRLLLSAQMPQLAGLPVRCVAEGHDHELFAAGGEWLVRFPRRAERSVWLERELSIMALVARSVPSGVPRPELTAGPSNAYPYPFFAYRRIPGVAADLSPVSNARGLAADIGHVLDALHRVNPGQIPPTPAGWRRATLEDERRGLVACGGAAARMLTRELAGRAEPYLTGSVAPPARQAPSRFVHNDICPDHLIVDPSTGRLAGIIDFTDAMLGDPLVDFVQPTVHRPRPRPLHAAARRRV